MNPTMVGSMVFSQADLLRILTALASAGVLHGPVYKRALGDVALAVGVTLPESLPVATWRVVDERVDVLERL